ncbi:MAG: protein translocase subunit SecF [Oscillospiraceae bacterium]|jgi:preprotein translocase subunit SecF|nr:protein translocase subunit SecF [Oscillospiraceae bacterium]
MRKSISDIKFDFVGKAKIAIAIPCVIFVAAIIVLLIFGADVAIEFRGGTMVTYSFVGDIDLPAAEDLVNEQNLGASRVTEGTAFGTDLKTLTVAFSSNENMSADVQSELTDALQAAFSQHDLKVANSQDVNPSTGSTFFLKCLVAILFSFILLIIYIALRFKAVGGWSSGVFALVALLVDVFIVMSAFVFFRISIDANFIAVVLTILGYSINNTIVIYDRIRENRTLLGSKISYRDLVNISTVQSLTRSINTTAAVVLSLLAICVVSFIYGVDSIMSFAFPMLLGMISGLYTSIFLVGPMWVLWREWKQKHTKAA